MVSGRAEVRILEDTDVSLGHQVAIMFQVVSALALEVPAFLQNIYNLRGVSPDVQLSCEPWGYGDHSGGGCECLSSACHDLSHMPKEYLPMSELRDTSVSTEGSGARISHVSGMGTERPGSVPFACSWLCMCSGRRACW